MTPEQHRAHKKLISRLPVREHKLPMDISDGPRKHGGGCPGKQLIVDGKLYKSLSAARKDLRCGKQRIFDLFGLGRAAWL